MNRRTVLKRLSAAGVTITILQACNFSEERVPLALNNLQITPDQEDLMKLIVDAVIPGGEKSGVPGALALGADKFVWVMADDCLDEEEQATFLNGLRGFEAFSREITGTLFSETDLSDRSAALTAIMQAEVVEVPVDGNGSPAFSVDDSKAFVGITKRWTMTGYMQSEHVMREVMPYKLVPQYFKGCVDTDPAAKININA